MRRVMRVLRLVLAAVVTVCALGGLARLHSPTLGPGGAAVRQLGFLRAELDGGAGDGAQAMFPEGYFFLHALYGLAWVDVGRHRTDRAEALREARWALSKLDAPQGTAPFSAGLTPRYGVFYAGWTNWLRGGILSLRDAAARDPAEVERFERDSRDLAAAFDASATPFLQAYPEQSWPVDSTVAIASLRLHDALLPARYGDTVRRWLDGARERLDPATGLLPHVTDPRTGTPLEGARATSQSVIQRFLADVDPVFARQQYLRFRELFVVRPLGIGPAVREYPLGTDGPGDVDSGPLPLGVSLSATVVTIGAARVEGDDALAAALSSYGELAGVPLDTPHTKRYALGLLPIGDAFLVWARTAEPWVAAPPGRPPAVVGPLWKAPLTLVLVLLATAPWLPRALRLLRRGGVLRSRLRGRRAERGEEGGATPAASVSSGSISRSAEPSTTSH
ncbi:hypothetical protein [Dactylosporangium sp. NPDC051484]|uniref:hypothetical protein n=1 Tax=Dactylosporangium sp. NPDC051484 TaxID=3154942 RepID=UPI00344B18BC